MSDSNFRKRLDDAIASPESIVNIVDFLVESGQITGEEALQWDLLTDEEKIAWANSDTSPDTSSTQEDLSDPLTNALIAGFGKCHHDIDRIEAKAFRYGLIYGVAAALVSLVVFMQIWAVLTAR